LAQFGANVGSSTRVFQSPTSWALAVIFHTPWNGYNVTDRRAMRLVKESPRVKNAVRYAMSDETKEDKLARLEQQLKDLKARLPEHCSGPDGYVGVHAASPAHWQKIEDLEDEIEKLKAEIGG